MASVSDLLDRRPAASFGPAVFGAAINDLPMCALFCFTYREFSLTDQPRSGAGVVRRAISTAANGHSACAAVRTRPDSPMRELALKYSMPNQPSSPSSPVAASHQIPALGWPP